MLLLARPRPHLARTLQALRAAGFAEDHILSFSLAEPTSLPVTLPTNATALVLTSLLALENLPATNLPTYCVGDATAAAARQKGLNVVFTGTTNAQHIAEHLIHPTIPTPQHIVHLHGDKADLTWHQTLLQNGHHITPLLAYQTNQINKLPTHIQTHLITDHCSLITVLFSSASAQHLANLLKHANITPTGTALCLSANVAKVAQGVWPRIVTAPAPTLEAMIATLQTLKTE